MNAPLTHHPAPVREYRDAAQLIADARELKRRMWAPTGIVERVPSAEEPRRVYSLPDPTPQSIAMREMTKGFWCPSMPARKILKALANEAAANGCDILGDSRTKPNVDARQRAMVILAMARTDLSIFAIGKLFGRDHTTVLHAFKRLGYAHGRTIKPCYPRRRLDGEARS